MSDRSEYMRLYRLKHKERLKQNNSLYYESNKEKLKNTFKDYYLKTKVKRRLLGKKHYEENKSLYLAYSRTRKATIKRNCPNSLNKEDFEAIKKIYIACKTISVNTGIIHHVDHVVPLQGEKVCGLHVPWNLQILTAEENLRKNNKHE